MTTDSETTGRKAGPWPRRAAVGGLLALLLLAFLAIRACRGTGVPADRVVRRDVVETLVVNGRVLAESKSAIASRLVGIVQEVPVREGDRVKKGQLLVLLNETEARAELEAAPLPDPADPRTAWVKARLEQAGTELSAMLLEDPPVPA